MTTSAGEEEPEKKPKLTGDGTPPAPSTSGTSAAGRSDESKSDDSENESESKQIAKKVRAEEETRKSEIGEGGEDSSRKPEAAAIAAADQAEKVLLMTTEQMEQLESTLLHGVLRRVDPVTADRLHPNNKRKIVR